jgi:hypothetical protein
VHSKIRIGWSDKTMSSPPIPPLTPKWHANEISTRQSRHTDRNESVKKQKTPFRQALSFKRVRREQDRVSYSFHSPLTQNCLTPLTGKLMATLRIALSCSQMGKKRRTRQRSVLFLLFPSDSKLHHSLNRKVDGNIKNQSWGVKREKATTNCAKLLVQSTRIDR